MVLTHSASDLFVCVCVRAYMCICVCVFKAICGFMVVNSQWLFIINYFRALIPKGMFPSRKVSYLLRVGAGGDELDFGPRIPLVFFCGLIGESRAHLYFAIS